MRTPHYQYFLALEQEFDDSIRFVELDAQNSNAFSTAYLKMLFAACVEIEAVLKELDKRSTTTTSANNMDQLRASILAEYPNFHKIEVKIPRYSLTLSPWASWASGTNPDWWHAYNATKHSRQTSYVQANQKNVVEALAGLFASLIYLYAAANPRVPLEIEPRLFEFDNLFPGHIVMSSALVLP